MSTNETLAIRHYSFDFGVQIIDQRSAAALLDQFVKIGSNIVGVSLNDLNTTLVKEPTGKPEPSLVDYVMAGGKLIDIMIWISMGRPTDNSPEVATARSEEPEVSMLAIAKAVFYCYFFLLTQARYPPATTAGQQPPNVPNFLRSIMGMGADPRSYVNMIFGFEPEKFGGGWIRHISFTGFGDEAINRFGLGVAGYRMFSPFKLLRVREDAPDYAKTAATLARQIAIAPPSWTVHPVTRDPAILNALGNLNKNLTNLMLECFSTEDLNRLAASKILYAPPVRIDGVENYKSWGASYTLSPNDNIFPSRQ